MEKKYVPDQSQVYGIGLSKKELRVLLFWASVGITSAKGGAYENVAPQMVEYFAKHIRYHLPYKTKFLKS